MRIVVRRQGCPFCVTEMLLDRTLLAGGRGFSKADLGELHDNIPGGEDHPLAGQIMGSDPKEMAAAALKMIEQRAGTTVLTAAWPTTVRWAPAARASPRSAFPAGNNSTPPKAWAMMTKAATPPAKTPSRPTTRASRPAQTTTPASR